MDGRFRTAVAALGLLYALCSHCSIAQPNDVTSTNDYDNQQATDIPPTNSPDVEEPHDSTGILEKGENPCHSAPDPGPCSAELVRFFYDVKSNQCRQFLFGGCQGTGNRFITENDCKEVCAMTTKPKPLPEEIGYGMVSSSMTYTSSIPIAPAFDTSMLTLANGNGETSFTFSSEYPFIQLKASDITNFKLRSVNLLFSRSFI